MKTRLRNCDSEASTIKRASHWLARVLATLSATNEAILSSSNVEEMLQKVIAAAVDGEGFLGAAIFLKANDSALLRMEACAGAFVDLIGKMHLSTDPSVPHGQELGGIAFRSNKRCISNDVTSDPRIRPRWDLAKTAGLKTCAVLPICVGGSPVGVIYFFLGDGHGQLNEEVTDLMSRLAENVSFGLEMLKRQEVHRSTPREQDDLHRMYVALSATNEAIMRSRTREELLELVCSAAVLGGKFTSTTIALAEPGEEFLRIAATKGVNAERVRGTRLRFRLLSPKAGGRLELRLERSGLVSSMITLPTSGPGIGILWLVKEARNRAPAFPCLKAAMQSEYFCFYPARRTHLSVNWSTCLRDWRKIFHLRSRTLIATQKNDRLTNRFSTLRPMMH